MLTTPIALYRRGNASSPRMDNVRPQDVETYEAEGQVWVVVNSGGISTFANLGAGKNWWKLNQGTHIPDQLKLINDYGNHWSWEPGYTMPLEEYKIALHSIGALFQKVS